MLRFVLLTAGLVLIGCSRDTTPMQPEHTPVPSPLVISTPTAWLSPVVTRVTPENYARLRGEMSFDEVVQLLGAPSDGLPTTRRQQESFTWNRPDWGHIYLVFVDDRLRHAFQNFAEHLPSEQEFVKRVPTPVPPFETVVFSGRGPTTTPTVKFHRGLMVVRSSHRGDSEFVASIAESGVPLEPVAWSRGAGESSWGFFVPQDAELEFLVEMGDDWTLTVDQPSLPPTQASPREVSGRGFTLLGPYHFRRDIRHFTLTSPDNERLLAKLMNWEGGELDYLVPAIGHSGYRTSLQVEDDLSFIQVESLATWTLTIE